MIIVNFPKISPFMELKVALDGTEYHLRFEWNQRSGWYFGLMDNTKEYIFAPKVLNVGQNLLRFTTDSRKPKGVLVLFDRKGLFENPGYDDLGTRHDLLYLTEDEL